MRLFPKYDGPSLIEQVCSVENLTAAWRRVRSNIHVARRGKSAGVDAVTLRDFEADWANQMAQLANALRDGSYRPLPPRRVSIPKRSGGERAIAILAVRDRIAQRAVQQVLEPLFDPLFLDCSFGCRPGVGVPEALAQVNRCAEQGRVWVVDADIQSYFDTIDQRMLLSIVRQRIGDLAVLRLIAQWLEVGTLTADSDEPFAAAPPTLLQRGKQVLDRVMNRNGQSGPYGPPPWDAVDPTAAPAWGEYDPYGVGAPPSWSPHDGAPGWAPPPAGWEQRVWTALTYVKPVIDGTRTAWPYVQRVGGRRLAIAGAVAAGAVAAGEMVSRQLAHRRGTPQGGALSPLLANIYLHPFDVALTSQGLRLIRFVDDFVLMCASRDEAERALALAQKQLAILRLTLHPNKTRIVNYVDGLEFLGQALVPRQRGPRLEDGLRSFEEARDRLKQAARRVRRKK